MTKATERDVIKLCEKDKSDQRVPRWVAIPLRNAVTTALRGLIRLIQLARVGRIT